METRSYGELRNYVENLYATKDKITLRRHAFKNAQGEIHVYRNTPAEVPLVYGKGTYNEHLIELRVPGRITFRDRVTRDITDEIQTFDIRIRIKNNRMLDFEVPTHIKIVQDLYNKIANYNDEFQRKQVYSFYAVILQSLYFDLHPLRRLNTTEEQEYQMQHYGFSTVELVSFIKWCTLQEDINYSPNNLIRDDWGKDLLFGRYFEAIYAGLYQNINLINDVQTRTKNHGQQKPPLWNKQIYQGTLSTRFALEEV